GTPAGVDSSKIGEDGSGAAAAKAHGAVAILSLAPARYAQFFKSPEAKQYILARESVRLKAGDHQEIPSGILPPDAAASLATALGTSVDALYETAKKGEALTPKPLDATANLAVTVTESVAESQNVVGILDGADPKLRDEYVAVSAHYDHLKTNEKGEIYPGADDDGSGTASVLALARAFSLNRPPRSILVVFHAGEELGLLGSAYNTDVS